MNIEAEYDAWSLKVALSQAIDPDGDCTIEGLADQVWLLNKEIGELRKRRDHLEGIVLRHAQETGDTIYGKKSPPCKAVDYVADVKYDGSPVWKWRLQYAPVRLLRQEQGHDPSAPDHTSGGEAVAEGGSEA